MILQPFKGIHADKPGQMRSILIDGTAKSMSPVISACAMVSIADIAPVGCPVHLLSPFL